MKYELDNIHIRLWPLLMAFALHFLSSFVGIFNILNLPFLYIEVFVHELGHAVSSLITGGMSYRITMGAHGGDASVDGGNLKLVLFGGYLFPPLIGAVLYIMVNRSFESLIRALPYIWSGVALVVGLLWVRDFMTFAFILMIWLVFRSLSAIESLRQVKLFLILVSYYLIISGFTAPYEAYDKYFGGDDDVTRLARLIGWPVRDTVYIWWGVTAFLSCLCIVNDYIVIFKGKIIEGYDELQKYYPAKATKDDKNIDISGNGDW